MEPGFTASISALHVTSGRGRGLDSLPGNHSLLGFGSLANQFLGDHMLSDSKVGPGARNVCELSIPTQLTENHSLFQQHQADQMT
jgi:hypothetical protein